MRTSHSSGVYPSHDGDSSEEHKMGESGGAYPAFQQQVAKKIEPR